ncbi:MAG: M1 family aminopeptidase [Planctomycetota bacterium]|nr:M1 family aminopeptidase [Planctomycetota bacterium]
MKRIPLLEIFGQPVRPLLMALFFAANLLSAGAIVAQEIDLYKRPIQIEPSHDFDVQHYRVTLAFDLEAKTFQGENHITLIPLRDGWKQCLLHAVELEVSSVLDSKDRALIFHQRDGLLSIDFAQEYQFGDKVEFKVTYKGSDPQLGLYFDNKSTDHPRMVSTDSFPNNARRWIPCYDYPHDKVTQELIITAPLGNKVLSNGRLVSTSDDPKAGTTTWHWWQEKPHATYLFMLAIGPFAVIKDAYGEIPVNYWVYPDAVEHAEWIFAKTPEMLDFYSNLFDFPYPWAKYDQVTTPHVGGGAEATSATVLGQDVIHDRRAEQDFSWEWILAHEVAHHWWGDLITLREWSHAWLHESFATYSDYLYTHHERGPDEGAWDLKGKKERYLQEAQNRYIRPIVFDRYDHPNDNFDSHTYPKGAAVLHMLRFVLGDDAFFAALSQFLNEHAHQVVDTHDFMNTVKDASGQNLDWFFEQFLFKPGHPVFEVSTTWNADQQVLHLQIAQVQDTSTGVPIYRIPVEIGLVTSAGKQVERIWLDQAEHHFQFQLPERPRLVRFDEGNRLLKQWSFPKEVSELLYQAEYDDAIGREWATREMTRSATDAALIPFLVKRSSNDSFWAVRKAAIEVLQSVSSGISSENLDDHYISLVTDSNSKVRVAALRALVSSGKHSHLALFRARFDEDDSYLAQAEALRAIGKIGSLEDLDFLERASAMPSPRGVLQQAAKQAIAEIRAR